MEVCRTICENTNLHNKTWQCEYLFQWQHSRKKKKVLTNSSMMKFVSRVVILLCNISFWFYPRPKPATLLAISVLEIEKRCRES